MMYVCVVFHLPELLFLIIPGSTEYTGLKKTTSYGLLPGSSATIEHRADSRATALQSYQSGFTSLVRPPYQSTRCMFRCLIQSQHRVGCIRQDQAISPRVDCTVRDRGMSSVQRTEPWHLCSQRPRYTARQPPKRSVDSSPIRRRITYCTSSLLHGEVVIDTPIKAVF